MIRPSFGRLSTFFAERDCSKHMVVCAIEHTSTAWIDTSAALTQISRMTRRRLSDACLSRSSFTAEKMFEAFRRMDESCFIHPP